MTKNCLKLEFGIKKWGILVYGGMLHSFPSRILGIAALAGQLVSYQGREQNSVLYESMYRMYHICMSEGCLDVGKESQENT